MSVPLVVSSIDALRAAQYGELALLVGSSSFTPYVWSTRAQADDGSSVLNFQSRYSAGWRKATLAAGIASPGSGASDGTFLVWDESSGSFVASETGADDLRRLLEEILIRLEKLTWMSIPELLELAQKGTVDGR